MEGHRFGDGRYPIDGVSTIFDMSGEFDMPGIPRAQNGNYELIWNGTVVERHVRLIDLGIQNNDELILVFVADLPEHLRSGGAFRRGDEGPDPSFSAGCPNSERPRLS